MFANLAKSLGHRESGFFFVLESSTRGSDQGLSELRFQEEDEILFMGFNSHLENVQIAIAFAKFSFLQKGNSVPAGHRDNVPRNDHAPFDEAPDLQELRGHVWHLFAFRTNDYGYFSQILRAKRH